MLNFIQKNFIKINLNKNDSNKDGDGSYVYRQRTVSYTHLLVDTGCNAEQRALAEKYADKIIDFIWCNDFAAARNAGLKEACLSLIHIYLFHRIPLTMPVLFLCL